jgi:hypothetical protein
VKDVNGKNMKIANPAYETWAAQDQHILSFLLSSLSKDILLQVTAQPTAAAAWREIECMFSSQTRARIVNTRIVLSTTKKGDMTMVGYFTKMRQLGDEMVAAGRRLDDDELIEYILAGLDYDYNPAVSAVLVRPEPISLSELYSNLLAFKTRLDLIGHESTPSSANMVCRGRGGGPAPAGRSGGRGRGSPASGRGRDPGSFGRGGQQQRHTNSEVCSKVGHTADRC